MGVSVLCPAVVDTPLLDEVYAAPASLGGPSVRARIRLAQPRFLTPEHVARRAVDGLAANRAVIPVGGLAQTLWRVHRYAPALMAGGGSRPGRHLPAPGGACRPPQGCTG